MISYAFIDAFTPVARDEAIERVKRAIAAADGVISDFAFFGHQAIRLTVELDAGSLAVLRRELDAAEVELFAKCVADLEDAKKMNARRPIVAMLHVTFVPAEAPLELRPPPR
jgi:alkylation response protein AidB-like acyl-CoA dehydrogenase